MTRYETIIGLEVPHVHIHLIPIDAIADLDFSKAELWQSFTIGQALRADVAPEC